MNNLTAVHVTEKIDKRNRRMSKKFKLPHHDLLRTLIKTNNRKIWMKNGQYWSKK